MRRGEEGGSGKRKRFETVLPLKIKFMLSTMYGRLKNTQSQSYVSVSNLCSILESISRQLVSFLPTERERKGGRNRGMRALLIKTGGRKWRREKKKREVSSFRSLRPKSGQLEV